MFDRKFNRKISTAFLVITISFAAFFPLKTVLAEDFFNKHFEWYYEGSRWTWSLSIPKSLYNSYKSVSVFDRTKEGPAGYSFLVTTQDYYVRQVANKLHEAASKEGYGAYDEVSFILAFVQSLPYTSDSVTTQYDEYPRFPIETLVDDGGDCEDTSILFATLVFILNYGAIFISPPNHFAVGVLGKDIFGSYYTYKGKKYYYCETTGDNWKIGEIPSDYQNVSAYLYPIDKSKQYMPSQDISPTSSKPNGYEGSGSSGTLLVALLVLTGAIIVIIGVIAALTKLKKVHKAEEIAPPPPPIIDCN